MITRKQAETLQEGDILQHVSKIGASGRPIKAVISGKPRFWADRPGWFSLYMTYGARTTFYINPKNAIEWEIPAK